MYRAATRPNLVYRCEHSFANYEQVAEEEQSNVQDKTFEAVDESDRPAQDEES